MERRDDGAVVQQDDLGLVTLCEILFVMLMMDTRCISLEEVNDNAKLSS